MVFFTWRPYVFKHSAVLAGLAWALVALPDAFGQVPTGPKASSPVGPAAVHVPERLIPRQPPREDDWPMRGCDAGNTFCNRHEKTLAPPLVKVWDVNLRGALDGVVVSSGIVLATGLGLDGKNTVFALDARTGRRLWTFTLPGGGRGSMACSPGCFGDLAFFGGQNDKSLYAINLRTGQLRWHHDEIGSMFDSPVVAADGVLYVNSVRSGLWVFDAKTGDVKWRDKAPGGQADIAVKGGKLLRAGGTRFMRMVAFDAATGKESWREAGGSRPTGLTSFRLTATDDLVFVTYAGEPPVVVNDQTLKRFKYDRIAAFRNSSEPTKVWETALKEDAYYGGLVLAGGSLYAATREGSIYCLDAQTGKVRKERPFKEGWGRLIGTDNVLFASCKQGLVALAPKTLETLWATELPGFQVMAVANGRLYVAAGSRIVAFANGKRGSK
jgi:outer membrane protein assembly factor BamB